MGVNKEKEPLSGTAPERRLFDRSLHRTKNETIVVTTLLKIVCTLKKLKLGYSQNLKRRDIGQLHGDGTRQAVIIQPPTLTRTQNQ